MMTAKEFDETRDMICNHSECPTCILYDFCAHGMWSDRPMSEMLERMEQARNEGLYKSKKNRALVFDVAKYILKKTGRTSVWKLQKLCYYSQAWHLAWTGCPMFEQDFEAWANGPVCPELFRLHDGKFWISADELALGTGSNLTEDEKDSVDRVLETYGNMAPWELREQTHAEMPWKRARENVPEGAECHKTIPKEWMEEYCESLRS